MDMTQYLDLFVSESRVHINIINELIVRLEEQADDREALDELFRHAHSLKGMAATMQIEAITALAHRTEDLLGRVRNGEFRFTSGIADLLFESSDLLSGMIAAVELKEVVPPAPLDLLERLTAFTPLLSAVSQPAELSADQTADNSGAVDDDKPRQHSFRKSDSFRSVRVKTDTLDHLVNITGELITTRHRLAELAAQHGGTALEEPVQRLSNLLRELRDEVFQARMLPFSFVSERFPRLVRDLAHRQGKEISFRIIGKEIELDRGILEEITEPLVHILRNAVDHGMETPEERTASAKPHAGSITLTVTREKEHADIIISDDGRGMDPENIKRKAIARGILSEEQAAQLSRQAALLLVCAPGFSTAEQISDISGRGVGMDAVKTAVHLLGGTLTIESESGRGSCFALRLPISVSIIHALLVDCGTLQVAFPVNVVARTVQLTRRDILDDGGRKVFLLDGCKIPVKSLNRLLAQPMSRNTGTTVSAVVAQVGEMKVALIADRLVGQQEIFVKPLGTPLAGLRGLSGGAITGDGRIVFVMDASIFI